MYKIYYGRNLMKSTTTIDRYILHNPPLQQEYQNGHPHICHFIRTVHMIGVYSMYLDVCLYT